jgi:hypothetical protein
MQEFGAARAGALSAREGAFAAVQVYELYHVEVALYVALGLSPIYYSASRVWYGTFGGQKRSDGRGLSADVPELVVNFGTWRVIVVPRPLPQCQPVEF